MSNVIIFNTTNKRVNQYLKNVHTSDYMERNDAVINPQNAGTLEFNMIPQKYWMVTDSLDDVREMTQAEKDLYESQTEEARKQALRDAIDSGDLGPFIVSTFKAFRMLYNEACGVNVTLQAILNKVKELEGLL